MPFLFLFTQHWPGWALTWQLRNHLWCLFLILGCLAAFQSWLCSIFWFPSVSHCGKQQVLAWEVGSLPGCGRPELGLQLPASTWLSCSCCRHFGSSPVESLSIYPSLCSYSLSMLFKKKKFKGWAFGLVVKTPVRQLECCVGMLDSCLCLLILASY